jgi:hypothetical protein
LYSIVRALREYRYYVGDGPIIVHTDHHSLIHWTSIEPINPRLTRWIEELMGYDLDIQYVSGPKNPADPISRIPMNSTTVNLPLQTLNEDWPLWYVTFFRAGKYPQSVLPQHHHLLDRQKRFFVVRNSQVFRRIHRQGETFEAPFIPLVERAETMKSFHHSHGHLGATTLYSIMSTRAWWPSLLKDLRLFVQTCSTCQLNFEDTPSEPAPTQPIAPTIQPFRRWGIDFVGPISDNPSIKGNRYIITAIDYGNQMGGG